MKTYAIKANRTAKDVIENNDITLETGYTLEEARIASIQYQKTGEFVAVWIEEEVKATPRVVRSVESDRTGVRAPDRDMGDIYDGSAGSGGKLVKGWRGVKISMNEDNSRCS